MDRTFAEKEAALRKRLLIICPIACFVVFLLFITSDVVPYEELRRVVGWEGAMQVLPDITIIPDSDPFEDMLKTSRPKTLAAMDLDIVSDHAPTPGGSEDVVKPDEPEEETIPELDISDIRHYPSHTEVPYSEEYVILHMVQPDYPPNELLEGIEGDVTVELLVNEAGYVENAWILAALGPKSFEEASLEAVRQFRFRPPIRDGRPIPMWIRFQVRFRLLS